MIVGHFRNTRLVSTFKLHCLQKKSRSESTSVYPIFNRLYQMERCNIKEPIPKLKCLHCPYSARDFYNLKRHCIRNHGSFSPPEPPMELSLAENVARERSRSTLEYDRKQEKCWFKMVESILETERKNGTSKEEKEECEVELLEQPDTSDRVKLFVYVTTWLTLH
jgi:hypothetical protein